MKRYISISLFAFLIMISACKRKCALCEWTNPDGSNGSTDICRKDFGNKVEWEAEIKRWENLGSVCTVHK